MLFLSPDQHSRCAEGTRSIDANWGQSLTGPQSLLLNQLPRDGMYHPKMCQLSNTSTPQVSQHVHLFMSVTITCHETSCFTALYFIFQSLRMKTASRQNTAICPCPPTEGAVLLYASCSTSPQPFYGLFPGPPGWAGARGELLDFMVQGKINRGRHTDHPAGCHSIQTNQCPCPPSQSPHFLQAGCPSCHPTNSVKELKAIARHQYHKDKHITGRVYSPWGCHGAAAWWACCPCTSPHSTYPAQRSHRQMPTTAYTWLQLCCNCIQLFEIWSKFAAGL